MVASRICKRTSFATGCALALITAVFGDQAHAESNLDASYTISFARIRVGEITASVVFGPTEYAMSASGRAGGLMKALMDGEGSFTTRGTITDGHPVPTNFTSKIVSNAETSDVTMVLDEGSVKELAATPLSSSGRVPVTEANRQGIIDPLTAMLFWAVAPGAFSQETCRRTLPIFDGHQRYDLKLAFKRMDKVTAEKGYAGPVVVCSPALRTHRRPYLIERPRQISFGRSRNGGGAGAGRWYAPAGAVPAVGREHARKLGH